MGQYFKKLLYIIFCLNKGLLVTCGMHTIIITGHDSFEQIETDLRIVQQQAITEIIKNFSLIPKFEWRKTLKDIDSAVKKTRRLMLENPEKQYHFQPILEKEFQMPVVNGQKYKNASANFLLTLNKELSLTRFALCAQFWSSARNIKPGIVTLEHIADPTHQASAFATSNGDRYQRSYNENWRFIDIGKQRIIKINWPFWNNNYFTYASDKQYTLRQIDCINHELTHLIEAHGTIHGILENITKHYYPNINLENNSLFINLQKAHELIATVVPLMISLPSALNQKTDFHSPSVIHPSGADLKPWLDRILYCYKNCYGTIN